MSPRNRSRQNNSQIGTQASAVWGGLADLLNEKRQARVTEEEFRLDILNALIRTPHGDIEPYVEPFKFLHDRDPLFFVRLGCWYNEHGTVHDLKQLFIAFLCTSKFSDQFRECGLALLERLPPYQVQRVLYMIKGEDKGNTFQRGLGLSVPRSFKTTVKAYLKKRESNKDSFESAVLHAREAMSTLYCSLRIKPGEYAQRVLFDNDPPEGSRLYGLKLLSWSTDPEDQAMIIADYQLPYRAAVSAIKWLSPPVMIAIVDAMSPQELINNLASLRKRGAFENPDIRAFIECKLEDAQTDRRVSALKTRQAIKSAGLTGEIEKQVTAVGDARIKSLGKIGRSTALFIDKSASMEEAIEVGKQVASIIAPICTKELNVYAFDTIAYPIKAKGNELSDWENAFKGITANGSTSCGSALEALIKDGKTTEQIIIVTDQEENAQPFFERSLVTYSRKHGVTPDIVIVNVGLHSTYLEDSLKKHDAHVDTYTFNGDYYSLPSLIPLLSQGTRSDLLADIMRYELPERLK